MKILFLDHAFHKKTKSSNFFLDLIKNNFDRVDVEYVDPDQMAEIAALKKNRVHDLVILWQLDYLAPIFLAAGYRTIVVPMYDGSANMPYEHWIGMGGASFINFSRILHERVIGVGCRSLSVKYYLAPVKEDQLPKFDDLRAILWMRRPQDGITPGLIQRMVGNQLKSLHVHNAPDDGLPKAMSDYKYGISSVQMIETRWNSETNTYLDALKKCNVFFAPRMSEGIGMAMLEAFSRGLLVMAADNAVHNEYVSNWVNGILFNRDVTSNVVIPLDTAREIAFNGWCGAVSGYQEWLETHRQIVQFIKDTPENTSVSRSVSPTYIAALFDAYSIGGDAYLGFLREHVIDWGNRDAMMKIVAPIKKIIHTKEYELPVLDEDGLFFGTTTRSVSGKIGLADSNAFSAMLTGDSVTFSAKLNDFITDRADFRIVLDCELLEIKKEQWLIIAHLNQLVCARQSLPNRPGDFTIEIPLNGIRDGRVEIILTLIDIESQVRESTLPEIKFKSIRLKAINK
ncbi:glycosyltransferase [Comamonas sp. HJ-2]